MSFKKLRGVHLPEPKQGMIYYTCLNLQEQPLWVKNKFERLCIQASGVYHCALRELLTTQGTVTGIAMKYHVSESMLYDARTRFYESW